MTNAMLLEEIDASPDDSPTLAVRIIAEGEHAGWFSLETGIAQSLRGLLAPQRGDDGTNSEDMMLLYFTSGTTGMPKMVLHDFTYPAGAHSHREILAECAGRRAAPDGGRDRLGEGGVGENLRAVVGRHAPSSSSTMTVSIRANCWKSIARNKVTTFCAPPTIYRFLIKEDLRRYDLSALKYCVVAGEPLNPEVYNAFFKATGLKLDGRVRADRDDRAAGHLSVDGRREPGSMGGPRRAMISIWSMTKGSRARWVKKGRSSSAPTAVLPVGMFDGYYRDEALTGEYLA